MTLEEIMVAYFDRKGFIEYVGKDPCHKLFPDAPEPDEEVLEADAFDAIPAVLDSVEDIPEPSLRDILEAVIAVTGIKAIEIKSPHRAVRITRARAIIVFIARSMTSKSFPQIGRFLNRDHTTAVHAFQVVSRDRSKFEPEISQAILNIKAVDNGYK